MKQPVTEARRIFNDAVQSGKALAMYRLPNTKAIRFICGKASHVLPAKKRAFVFARFDKAQKPWYIIESSKSHTPVSKIVLKHFSGRSTSKKAYLNLVNNLTAAIAQGQFRKVVAARAISLKKPVSFEPCVFFERLCKAYQDAFVSLTYIPGEGLWLGASPELLLSCNKDLISTYSLAGTKAAGDKAAWTLKEREEQQIVTDFIMAQFNHAGLSAIQSTGPKTRRSGGLKHLLTVLYAKLTRPGQWRQMVSRLHPTPAVAGLPRPQAIRLIAEQETFDREYYSGYLGPVNDAEGTSLFVNIRCMQETKSRLVFYAGCGITASSDPLLEWQESERKIEVLRSML